MNLVAYFHVYIVSVNLHLTENLMFCLCEICGFHDSEETDSGPLRYDAM
jgi:hypothetical protein